MISIKKALWKKIITPKNCLEKKCYFNYKRITVSFSKPVEFPWDSDGLKFAKMLRLYFKFWKLIKVLKKTNICHWLQHSKSKDKITNLLKSNVHVWTLIAVIWLPWSFRYDRTNTAGRKFHVCDIDPWQLRFAPTGGLCFAFIFQLFFAFSHFFVCDFHHQGTYHSNISLDMSLEQPV